MQRSATYPDGIGERHVVIGPARGQWFMLPVLGAILAAALLGAFGGGKNPVAVSETPAATLSVAAPATLRNGEFFEMRLRAEAREPIARPRIAVASKYWRDLTINTMLPAPVSETFEDGYFVFGFDPLQAGEALELKIDGQVNPPLFGGTAGAVALRDDRRLLAMVPLRLRVLP